MQQNQLYYGDNLKILRQYIQDETADLIYLDPPFNSDRNYNVLFKDESGEEAESQLIAFEDNWHWNQTAAETYCEIVEKASP
jgi:adenine specific DNA methylase Mod